MAERFIVPTTFERRRVTIFLAGAFGVSWLTALVIYLTGGLVDSPEVAGDLTLAVVLLPSAYMFGPAVGNVLARAATGEGRRNLRLRPETDGTWRYYAAAWLLPTVLVVLGGVLYFALFPDQFDPTMATFADLLRELGTDLDLHVVAAI